MDSGNSGSIQSSSGGDEEYDSRAETISAFLNNHHHHHSSSHVGPMPNPPPPQQPPLPNHHSSMFDPLSNYFDPLSSRSPPTPPQLGGSNTNHPNSLLNLDMVWSKNLRSEPNCTDLGGFIASSSALSTQQLLTNQAVLQGRSSTFPAMQLHENVTKGSFSGSSSVSGINIDQANINTSNNNNSGMVRNPKKRSRASRRAPTTVLTTDTTNFRAMVQEFTGIPAPPFTSSPFPRTRLDLFGTSSTFRSTNTHLDPSPPPYLLRPFAQKFHPPPFISPSTTTSSSASSSFPTSSMIDAIASTTTNITSSAAGSASNNNNNSNSNSTSINYQLPSDHHLGLLKPQQPQNLLNMNNMQNPILNLQSFLQAPAPPPVLGNKAGSLDIPTNDSHHLKIGVLEELGLSHGHLNTNLVVSDVTLPIRSDNNNSNNHPTNWPAAGDGSGSNDNDQGLLRSISSGNFNNSQRVTNGKVNSFSSSSSDFLRDKVQENVATTTRTEGMVESWICSSD